MSNKTIAFIAIAAIFLISILAIGADYWHSSNQQSIILDGQYADSLVTQSTPLPKGMIFTPLYIGDKARTIQQLAGQPVLVNIWASWCAPCVKEMPQLLALAGQRPELQLVLLSVDEDIKAAKTFMEGLAKQIGDNVTLAHDPDRHTSTTVFQTYRYPETILIDAQGQMTGKLVGLVDWENADVLEMVDALIATMPEKEPTS